MLTVIPVLLLIYIICSCSTAQGQLLVFSKTSGFYHKSIPEGIRCISEIGNGLGLKVDTTTNAAIFQSDSINSYQGIVFLNTTGDVLNEHEQKGLQNFIRQGRGFLGIHAASDTEMKWDWYNELVGAFFDGHPPITNATYYTNNNSHPSTKMIPEKFEFIEEIYNFRSIKADKINVIVSVDEGSYEGGKNGQSHPISWYREFEGGRSFYTNFGHRTETYSNPIFIDHISGGLKYVLRME
ncbi:ThuA domain-containing protein [Marinoscillum sp. MHG1-6]|uniref:ThuA domain-containing protein n=1 Tax=Marinoscillum sp. MHG1-6 TaxID=2959627 RepID=UPI002157D313|nr:ThuA domain-containing protein [Marinoscillum sp. MHG1-6]